MKQTVEIEVPDGKKAIWKDNKIVFEDIKPQLPKTWTEFCKLHPIVIDHYISRIINDKSLLPSSEAAEAHLALMQLHQLRDCYRKGWIPDWANNTEKYYIKHRKYCDGKVIYYIETNIDAHLVEFLSFQSKELAKEFLDNFKDLIEQAGDLI